MDHKNVQHVESILCKYLAPYPPWKEGRGVMIIKGTRGWVICSVKKSMLKACWIWLLSNRN